jgi:hypothetical protein
MTYICPVCGYDALFDPPWQDDSPSDDICPSCGIQFGYHDVAGGNPEGRKRIYTEWRQRWIDQGMPWHSINAQPVPSGWDPVRQLTRVTQT